MLDVIWTVLGIAIAWKFFALLRDNEVLTTAIQAYRQENQEFMRTEDLLRAAAREFPGFDEALARKVQEARNGE